MSEMFNQDSDLDGETYRPPPQYQPVETLEGPTSTAARLEVDDQFERWSQELEVKISEGLTKTLSQFENRLRSAPESLRHTVSVSIGARSPAMRDQECDLHQYQSVTEAPNVSLATTNFSI